MTLDDFFNKFDGNPEAFTMIIHEQDRCIECQIEEDDGDLMDELVRQYQDWTVIDYSVGFDPSYIWVEVAERGKEE